MVVAPRRNLCRIVRVRMPAVELDEHVDDQPVDRGEGERISRAVESRKKWNPRNREQEQVNCGGYPAGAVAPPAQRQGVVAAQAIAGDIFDILDDFAAGMEEQGKECRNPRAAEVARGQCAVWEGQCADKGDENITP